ncbi:hypothetical protein EON83_27785 [bacterium]|nr:MAG: hypothetical protein EON83_27785 [bacterium]
MENTNQFPDTGASDAETTYPDDSTMIADVLDDLDVFVGMIERTRVAVAKGKTEVRLVPRGKLYSVEAALDELGDAMTRRSLQVRAQRSLRDGVTDAKMQEVLGELEDGK